MSSKSSPAVDEALLVGFLGYVPICLESKWAALTIKYGRSDAYMTSEVRFPKDMQLSLVILKCSLLRRFLTGILRTLPWPSHVERQCVPN